MRNWEPIKAICDKATPGPWNCNTYYHEAPYEKFIKRMEIVRKDDEGDHIIARADWSNPVVANAQLIATARTALPEAIAEIEQLRQDKAELVEACKKSREFLDYVTVLGTYGLKMFDELKPILQQLLAKHGGEPK